MNKVAVPPKYLAVMSVARAISTWICADVAIIVGEYARATDGEIVSYLDLSGVYTAPYTFLDQHARIFKGYEQWIHDVAMKPTSFPGLNIKCKIMRKYPGEVPTYTTDCIIQGRPQDVLKSVYMIKISIDGNSIDRFGIGERELICDISTQSTTLDYRAIYWLPIVRILNARIGAAAKDYVL